MQKEVRASLNSDEWVTIRDFVDDGEGYTLPRYEAKFLDEVDKEFIEDDIVLVRETSAVGEGERLYHLPGEAVEEIGERLP